MKIDSKDFGVRPGEKVKLSEWPTTVKPFYKSHPLPELTGMTQTGTETVNKKLCHYRGSPQGLGNNRGT
jgi:hypothetical protein